MTPAELARQVRLLEITTKHSVTEVFAGEYSSAFRGRGIEFADVREYQPGDDIRSIDWNVTARAGKPFVKRFTEERELTIILAVDLSASGRFGTQPELDGLTGDPVEQPHGKGRASRPVRSKQLLSAEIAALLAFAAVRKGDRVGLLIFTDRVELFIPAKKGSRHTLRLIRELLSFHPKHPGTSLRAVSDHLARVVRRRSVVFVVSDFACADRHDPLQLMDQRHDVIAIDITDPRELDLVPAGIMSVRDPETGRTALIDTSSRKVRDAYHRATQSARDELAHSLQRIGVDRVSISTGSPYVHELAMFFRRREARR